MAWLSEQSGAVQNGFVALRLSRAHQPRPFVTLRENTRAFVTFSEWTRVRGSHILGKNEADKNSAQANVR